MNHSAQQRLLNSVIKPGEARNPTGYNGKPPSIAQLARRLTPQAFKRLEFWMNQDEYPAQSLDAIKVILDRGYGKAVQPIADGSNHEALELDLTGVSANELQRLESAMSKLLRHTRMMQDAPVIDLEPEPVKQAD